MKCLEVLIFVILLKCKLVQGFTRPNKTWIAKNWPNPRSFLGGLGLKTISKNPAFHLKERQSFTNRYRYPTAKPLTDSYGNPSLLCTDEYGSTYDVGIPISYLMRKSTTLSQQTLYSLCGNSPASLATSPTSHPPPSMVVTEIATTPQQSRRLQPHVQALIDTMTYVYIGAGLATLLLVTGALIFLVIWAQKKKTRQRVNNTDSC